MAEGWISSEEAKSNVGLGTPPYYLSPAQIEDYVEFAADAVQIVPAVTLTSVGIMLCFPDTMATWLAGAIYVIISIILIVSDSGMYLSRPQAYLARKFLGLSYVALGGLILNIAGIPLALAFN